ncbi:Methyl-accepting chemotaxis sensor/transducer protein [Pseudomonas chlororaphis subsp. aurantiaca]|uniref:methyl-accepting chemotaxis protein n=1 Tax=Pseudomonas chlororaphis TaxID=587753 RepID=UPI000F581907|nr:methyl-accepting chemotaxis protein [Pseudomonas chlororaphis]AZD35798.1 Methyl-accepting chemotaxis sensor/transducer protein [Pseudomonas chlororaphis subsp. aurantiaca]AZD42134.1 Methyl-accepting chemotaxis sensor/transducer protein [Pseudomonas chlororaphis subsp. aurantiaca]AZD54759.1 Methyl-accepting chemotaxis sensor/transducer protein [Pseudomonas chlororaphis subsp. aurantiaca]AZD60822.1 Methyl-accepting chemotaxis sensor/transducer protein [Pseudomonas chlororaphis subsp. aurantiac
MNSLRRMSISRRLWLILIVAVLMLMTLGMLMLKQINEDLYQAKVQKTQHVVQTANGVLAYFQGLESAGSLDRATAQKQALSAIRGLRYDQSDYFWINDLTPVMVMHPTNPKLDGQNLAAIRDPDGFAVFNEMVAIAKAKGAGMINYRWPKPGASEPVQKTSYVQLFQPWGWIIGSGVYIDDVQAEFRSQVVKASVVGIAIALLMALLVLLIARSIVRPLQETVHAMANIASGESDLTRTLDTHGQDEVTELARHFNGFTAKLRLVVSQLQVSASALAQSSADLGSNASQAQERSQQQSQQMELVATAINEVTYGVQDVAKNAEHAASEMRDAEAQAQQGQVNIDGSLQQIDRLSATIDQAVEVIRTLAQESTQIGSVLEVIHSIAEQTNLLALNAAIEAARAGEQGRGFAVVADEVRLLAQRTQKSTAEIQSMIERLQGHSEAAVKVIGDSSRASQQTIEQAGLAGESLNAIGQALRNLNGLNASIASATLQQAHVVEDINQNVTQAAGLSHSTALAAEQSSAASLHLKELSEQLNGLLRQFRV